MDPLIIKRSSRLYRFINSVNSFDNVRNTCQLQGLFINSVLKSIVVLLLIVYAAVLAFSAVAYMIILPVAYFAEGIVPSVNAMLASSVGTYAIGGMGCMLLIAIMCGYWLIMSHFKRTCQFGNRRSDVHDAIEIMIEKGLIRNTSEFLRLETDDQQYMLMEVGFYGPVRSWWIMWRRKVCKPVQIVD